MKTPFGRTVAGRERGDEGVAMALVMVWSVLMLGLVMVISSAVIRQIVPSDRSEHSYAALSAAEAGLADIEARLAVGTIMTVAQDETNPALTGWVAVPGGDSAAEFTYAIDATKSGAVGEVRAYVAGRSGDVVRVLEQVLSKRSTLDYVYMSDIESPAPDTPGVYGDGVTEYGSSGLTLREIARLVCSRRWYEGGVVTVGSTGTQVSGNQRNQDFCGWAGIYSSEKLVGKVHTNDTWILENTSLANTLGAGDITSSCRKTAEGLGAGEVGCSGGIRFIPTSQQPPQSGYTYTNPTKYQGDAWRPSGTDATTREPLYDSVLDLPPNPDLLKQRAAEFGCIYTGPTRIRFAEEGGVGYMYVTSPDTKLTRAGCDGQGGDGTALQSPATAQVTGKVNLTDFEDLVVYVQDVRLSTETDTAGADYTDPLQKYYWEKANRWVLGTSPTCGTKAFNQYPFVIPNDSVDQSYFNSGSTYKGFPSEKADPSSPWYGSSCRSGDMYVQGSYKGALMLSSDNNIAITSSLRDSKLVNPSATAGTADYGKPDPNSQSVLGIAASKFAYAYRPSTGTQASTYTWVSNTITVTYPNHGLKVGDRVYTDFTSGGATSKDGTKTVASVPNANTYTISQSGSGTAGNVTAYPYASSAAITWVPDWKSSNAQDPILDFALLAIQDCWGSQDPALSLGLGRSGNLYVWGSIAQKYRCVVGSSGGYGKVYKYDDRLTLRTPPYMLELSDEPWGKERTGEKPLNTQPAGVTQSWSLLTASDPVGVTIKNVKLAAAADKATTSISTSGSDVSITAAQPGLVVVVYEVSTADWREVRRLPVIIE